MKVICDRGALVDALNLAGSLVVARTPRPVLTCVRLAVNDGVMTVASTDLEVSLHLTVNQVEAVEDGEALIPAAKLAGIVRESSDPTLTIETDAEAAQILGEDSRFKLLGYAPAEFPPIDTMAEQGDFQIGAGQLHDLVNRTLFATARENSRYAINGVLMEREGRKLTMVATDGRRLAMTKGSVTTEDDSTSSAIIPTKALNLLARLFDDPSQTVRVKVAGGQAMFATDTATLTSNLVEGNFPPYKDVVPKDQDRKATFSTDALASGVRRAALLTNEESKGVKMAFSEEKLILSSRAPEMGEAEIVVPIDAYEGEPVEIGFNPQFITDVLKVLDADQVTMEFKASNKPGLLRSGSDFLYVVMPVSLS